MANQSSIIPVERIEKAILFLRGKKVMLDSDLAELYGVETKVLNLAVRRNIERFPDDFMFQLTEEEWEILRFQFGTSKYNDIASSSENQRPDDILRFQIETSKYDDIKSQGDDVNIGSGGRRYLPYAFTEQGVAMLSSVLRSDRAVKVNIEIMRAFVNLREMIASNQALSHRLDELEKKFDGQFRIVFDAIRQLMAPPEKEKGKIGFRRVEK